MMLKDPVVVVKVLGSTVFGIRLIFLVSSYDTTGELMVWVAQQCTSLFPCTSPLQLCDLWYMNTPFLQRAHNQQFNEGNLICLQNNALCIN